MTSTNYLIRNTASQTSDWITAQMALEYVANKKNEYYKQAEFNLCPKEKIGEVYTLRERCFSKSKAYLLNTLPNIAAGKDELDDSSFSYIAELHNNLLGSCRITPVSNVKIDALNPFAKNNCVLLSRLCIAQAHRNHNLHLYLLYYFSSWILNNTGYTEYIAYCTDFEFRLYEKLGAKIISTNKIYLFKNQINGYHIVGGRIDDFNNLIIHLLK